MTYREACTKYGILEYDVQWDQTLKEATFSTALNEQHQLSSVMLMRFDVHELLKLWATHKISMAEDIPQMIQGQTSAKIATFNNVIYNVALLDLDT